MTKILTVAFLCASLSLPIAGLARASSSRHPDQVIQWNRTLLPVAPYSQRLDGRAATADSH